MPLKPRQPAPNLEVALLDGGVWRLKDATPQAFQMIVAYRGLHCAICKTYLIELEAKLSEFTRRGVDVMAISADSRIKAARTKAEWGLTQLQLGYDLPISTAREWELFISRTILDNKPHEFNEPGLFLIKPDGTLFYASRSNAPWGRPTFEQIIKGIDIVIERKSDARGDV